MTNVGVGNTLRQRLESNNTRFTANMSGEEKDDFLDTLEVYEIANLKRYTQICPNCGERISSMWWRTCPKCAGSW